MESLMATVAQSDKEAKAVAAFSTARPKGETKLT